MIGSSIAPRKAPTFDLNAWKSGCFLQTRGLVWFSKAVLNLEDFGLKVIKSCYVLG